MEEYSLKIAPKAVRDFFEIGRYISPGNPAAADEFGDELIKRARSLTTFPYRHGMWARQPNIRKVPYASYLIFYKIHDQEQIVEILRFWHGARDQKRLRLREEDAVYSSTVTP